MVAQDAAGDIGGQGERNTGELWLRTTSKWRCNWSACFPARYSFHCSEAAGCQLRVNRFFVVRQKVRVCGSIMDFNGVI